MYSNIAEYFFIFFYIQKQIAYYYGTHKLTPNAAKILPYFPTENKEVITIEDYWYLMQKDEVETRFKQLQSFTIQMAKQSLKKKKEDKKKLKKNKKN